jgi:two-component system response regulator MprA
MVRTAQSAKLILVVEDDPDIRGALIEILAEENYHAVGIANGELALNFLRSAQATPSLILLDLMMPAMNGWKFRKEQQGDLRLRKIPVVVVTADGNAQQKAKQIDAQGWVRKPIEIEVLLATVARCCI